MSDYFEHIDGLKPFEKIYIPDDSRLFLFGDVHGNKNHVDKLIKKAGGTDKDHYCFVGDIIDRGKFNSALLFDMVHKDNYHMCLGNHECFLIRACDDPFFFDNWVLKTAQFDNGGSETFESLKFPGMNFFRKLLTNKCPVILEVEHKGVNFGLIHAEVPLFYSDRPYLSDWKDIVEYAHKDIYYGWDMLWGRNVINNVISHLQNNTQSSLPKISGIDYVIHGHTGVKEPLNFKNMFWIDTGFCAKKITMLEYDYENKNFIIHQLNDREEHEVRALNDQLITD